MPVWAYLYQLEANGSATYLTKVTAPDGASDYFDTPFPVGQYSAVGAHLADPGVLLKPGGLSLSIRSQWIHHLPDQ